MLWSVDFSSDIPIYRQLADQIISFIAEKKLRPGDKLPSIRELSGDLGINLHTVNKAYKLLADDGFLVMTPSGVFVNASGIPAPDLAFYKKLDYELERMAAICIARGVEKAELIKRLDEQWSKKDIK
ncbi:GntR family transcriptional regulator [Spirochaetia bacterium 38H-sp]|uniref:GntR family transcriptional regulator n=1 Tax=Rarispira pelagica TaxID=3141764 RepID=A0ABU9UAE4_9SPIR